MSKLAKALTAAAGNAAGESLYVEDVFSTYLYAGTGAARDIENGIDLDGEGGLVWIKSRDLARGHNLYDSERTGSAYQVLSTDTTSAQYDVTRLSSLNTNGFSLVNSTAVNGSGEDYASWTFRKAEKFFDVVTYTGDGASSRYINHNLGANAGAIFIKRTDSASDWTVQHRYNNNYNLYLNSTSSQSDSGATNRFNDTEFTVIGSGLADSNKLTNISGATYVAYLFASDAGGFGDDGSESIIKCGSFTLDGSGNASIDCGFEPQWVLAKRTDGAQDWYLTDMMRGMAQTTNGSGTLSPNLADAEYMYNRPKATATGFDYVFIPNTSYIYIAIRRPMKTPESGTEVYQTDTRNGTFPGYVSNFPVDMAFFRYTSGSAETYLSSRLTQGSYLWTQSTAAENADSNMVFDSNIGWYEGVGTFSAYRSWMFKRATGFFDVVAYSGTGVAGSTVAHNLGVAPELMIVKARNVAIGWQVYTKPTTATNVLILETTAAAGESLSRWNYTEPTDAVFTLGNSSGVNSASYNYIAYLFSSVAGVSKVGSYTGDGNASQNIDCGFASGARFVLIKSTNAVGSWFVFDTARGIVAGNDSRLELNATSAEVTSADVIDPYSAGFAVTNNSIAINVLGREYIFLAIA